MYRCRTVPRNRQSAQEKPAYFYGRGELVAAGGRKASKPPGPKVCFSAVGQGALCCSLLQPVTAAALAFPFSSAPFPAFLSAKRRPPHDISLKKTAAAGTGGVLLQSINSSYLPHGGPQLLRPLLCKARCLLPGEAFSRPFPAFLSAKGGAAWRLFWRNRRGGWGTGASAAPKQKNLLYF